MRTPKATAPCAFLLISFATACAPPAGPRDIETELAELRREHEEMRAELESMRRQLEVHHDSAPSQEMEPPTTSREEAGIPTLTVALEIYRKSLEAGDVERIRSAVYGGQVPEDDERLLKTIVDRTQQLELDLETRRLDVQGRRARLVVEHAMNFRLRLTQEQRRARVALVMLFEEGPSGWRLVGIGRD